jgi:hypothetical protein
MSRIDIRARTKPDEISPGVHVEIYQRPGSTRPWVRIELFRPNPKYRQDVPSAEYAYIRTIVVDAPAKLLSSLDAWPRTGPDAWNGTIDLFEMEEQESDAASTTLDRQVS